MDKILEFINNKTNNKYKDLLFFDAIYNQKNSTMQIVFKNTDKTLKNAEIADNLQVLCKQFVGDLVDKIVVTIKTDNISLAEFKNIIKQSVANAQELSFVNSNQITFEYDGDTTIVNLPVFDKTRDVQNLSFVTNHLQDDIFAQTNKLVKFNFKQIAVEKFDVIEARQQQMQEDGKIFEALDQSKLVNYVIKEVLYGEIKNGSAYLAGSEVADGKATIVGKVKSCLQKTSKPKVDEKGNTKQRNYYVMDLEYDGNVTSFVSFLSNSEVFEKIKEGESLVVEGTMSPFSNSNNLVVKAFAKCEFEEPKKVWRDCPSNYRFVFPQQYQQFEQANFFSVEQQTQCEQLKNNTYVVYDLETTGLSADNDKIVDIGAFKIKNGKIVEMFSTFVNPMCPIPAEASKINRITNDLVKDSPTIEQALPDFYKFCHGAIMLGYNNISFDDNFVNKAGKNLFYNFDNKRMDAMQLAQTYIKGIRNYKLGTVCAAMDVQLVDAHRAVNDALATAKLFIKIMEKFC